MALDKIGSPVLAYTLSNNLLCHILDYTTNRRYYAVGRRIDLSD